MSLLRLVSWGAVFQHLLPNVFSALVRVVAEPRTPTRPPQKPCAYQILAPIQQLIINKITLLWQERILMRFLILKKILILRRLLQVFGNAIFV